MKTKIQLILLTLMLSLNAVVGQERGKKNTRVDRDYNNQSYMEVIKDLEKYVEKNEATPQVLARLGNSYYFNANMEEASKWYELLIQKDVDIDTEYYYRYAMALKSTGKYEMGNKYMKKFATLNPTDSRAVKFSNSPDYLTTIDKLSGNFYVENLSTNTKYSDFGTSYFNDGIVFASSRGEGKLYKWNDQPFLDLYFKADTSQVAELFSDKINTRYHESSTTFTKDGKTMYFTRNNYYQGETKKSERKVIGLKIYRATLEDGEWRNIESLPFNNDNYNVAHPALSLDEKKLYFASDMEGSIGGSDLYVVDINEDGSFGIPKNLGDIINTEGRENFPYISNNGTLYFSSDGHLGLGGLDIFYANIESKTPQVLNLGKTINSPADDFEFIIDEFKNTGYLTSNRKGGQGDDDIYKFKREACNQLISGSLVDNRINQEIVAAEIVIYDIETNEEVYRFESDKNGTFSYNSNCREDKYKAVATKEGFEPETLFYLVDPNNPNDINLVFNLTPTFPLVKEEAAPIGTDLTDLLDLDPIYFDFDKSHIRLDAQKELDKVIRYLIAHPEVKLDVQSHTDSRGTKGYNMALSERRNRATKQWLIEKGDISSNRISGKGYGESQLVNTCDGTVSCTEEEHQKNRRSMFIISANK
ncbi:OmpA family protein [Bizionia paragorgiae]|uniref:Outer membrane protein OmpA n=1 Tax=Bizionia paragorgiae TaxID=283786 RepID=A0A1H4DIA5_BIZPA|nr:OmpA family protein [Bizionia paragorgiae]SEA71972.1 Outer membrane protein OmpA [Bizionia paragorgiae]